MKADAEQALQLHQEREQLFRAFFDESFQFALILDLQGNIIEINEVCKKICGPYAKNVIGRPLWEAGWWRDSPDAQKKTRTAIEKSAHGELADDEVTFLDKNGEMRHGRRIFSLLYSKSGDIIYITVVGQDITEHNNATYELILKEEALRRAQEAAKTGSWWFDPATKKVTWTDEMFHVFGLEPGQEVPEYSAHRKIIHPDDWEKFDKAVSRAVNEGIGDELELKITYPNGQTGWVNSICKSIKNQDGIVTQLVGTLSLILYSALYFTCLQ